MADRPIIFSAPMVQALLAGRKTQTRRFAKNRKHPDFGCDMTPREMSLEKQSVIDRASPYGGPGDRLWVRENWGINHYVYGGKAPIPKARPADLPGDLLVHFATESDPEIINEMPRRPSIHMPRWASRLTLIVEAVKLERLQEISAADAQAEGVEWESADPPFYYVPGIWPHSITAVGLEETGGRHAERSFAKLWNHINGAGAWDANPWVIATTFRVERRNIDAAVESTDSSARP